MKNHADVAVVMGSKSDLPVMAAAVETLNRFGAACETQILSAHRTPKLIEKSAREWESRGVSVVIAGAGGAAHLPGMIASYSILPVIGVPIGGRAMSGLDALLSVAQMPRGVPVACVAVDNAVNAALLALEILALGKTDRAAKFRRRLKTFKRRMESQVRADRKKLGRMGVRKFLKGSSRR